MRTTLLLALTTLVAMSGCSDKTDSERCDELSSYVAARAMVDQECSVDLDCHVIYVRPDQPIAGRVQPDDPALDAALRAYREAGCGEMVPFEGEVYAVCEAPLNDLDDPDAGVSGSLPARRCELRGDVPAPDVGFDVTFDADERSCDCGADAPCGDGEVCACTCVASSECAEACARAYSCEAMADLGLGRTGEACVASCEARAEERPAMVSCLQTAACDALAGCLTR